MNVQMTTYLTNSMQMTHFLAENVWRLYFREHVLSLLNPKYRLYKIEKIRDGNLPAATVIRRSSRHTIMLCFFCHISFYEAQRWKHVHHHVVLQYMQENKISLKENAKIPVYGPRRKDGIPTVLDEINSTRDLFSPVFELTPDESAFLHAGKITLC